jgi:hypothetical protein
MTTRRRFVAAMRIVPENSTSTIVNIARNPCAADVSAILAAHARRRIRRIATRRRETKARRADSESRILAMKKFSRATPSRRIGVRQNRIFARIAQRRFAGAISRRAVRTNA